MSPNETITALLIEAKAKIDEALAVAHGIEHGPPVQTEGGGGTPPPPGPGSGR